VLAPKRDEDRRTCSALTTSRTVWTNATLAFTRRSPLRGPPPALRPAIILIKTILRIDFQSTNSGFTADTMPALTCRRYPMVLAGCLASHRFSRIRGFQKKRQRLGTAPQTGLTGFRSRCPRPCSQPGSATGAGMAGHEPRPRLVADTRRHLTFALKRRRSEPRRSCSSKRARLKWLHSLGQGSTRSHARRIRFLYDGWR
jgi:hypothetical protein